MQVPDLLQDFVVKGALPSASSLQDAAVVPTLKLGEAMEHLREAAAASALASSSRNTSPDPSSRPGGSTTGISSSSSNGF